MDQSFDIDIIQLDKQAKAGDAGDGTVEGLAHFIHHKFALEPVDDVAGRIISAAFGHGAGFSELDHVFVAVTKLVWRLAGQCMFNPTMHEQIRIATYRRGKVGIVFQRQPEVADVVRAVHCLIETAQHNGLYQVPIRALSHLLQHLGIVFGLRLFTTWQGQAEIFEEGTQVGELFLLWCIVDAEQRRDLVLLEKFRGTNIGGDHAFLDQLMRVIPLQGHDAFDLFFGTELNHRFGSIEVDGATRTTTFQKSVIEIIQMVQVRDQ